MDQGSALAAAHDVGPSTLPQMPATPRTPKRSRENETPAQRQKREKAAERQRRKRERDRMTAAQRQHVVHHHIDHQQHQHDQQQQQQPPLPPPPPQYQSVSAPIAPPPVEDDFGPQGQELSPEEAVRKEKVRAAARERQRKHRALVKAKKMQELGVDMGNPTGLEDVQYRINPDGSYQPVYDPDGVYPGGPDQPQAVLGGQTFASTLLLSFSCAPLLKQHLLRTLGMTSDELASLEPVIADAWDKWDADRRYRSYAAQQAAEAQAAGYTHHAQHYPPAPPAESSNEFRTRFHRPLTAPSPFGQMVPPPAAPAEAEPADLGHARGEAEGVAEKLGR